MAGIPGKPDEIFPGITRDFQEIFGNDLVSIILYGSGASGHYIPGKSDINFLVILTEAGMEKIEKVFSVIHKWRKRKVAVPLFMTRSDMCSSLDSYPIEYLNMKRTYQTVYGEDVLGELKFDPAFIRLQCERELKGKSLLLLQRFLETEGESKKVRELMEASITAFLSVFAALLFLKGAEIPRDRREMIRASADAFGLDPEVFLKCVDMKEGKAEFKAGEILKSFRSYLKEVRRLAEVVDQMKVE
ncbi:MAG: hypothetical protein ACE14T_02310 [Syntrophales bacterium]